MGYGTVSTCLNIGVVLGPYAAGAARDVTGSYHVSLDLTSIFALLVTLLAGVLYLARRPIKG